MNKKTAQIKRFDCAPDDCAKERTLGAGLAAFAKRYQLSSRKLSAACGGPQSGVSKSSADRICRGVAELRVVEVMRHAILDNLKRFLAALGKSDDEIESELQSIFTTQEVTQMIAARTKLPSETVSYFHLRRDPFTGDPRSADEVFTSKTLDHIVEQVEDAINYQGFMAVIGEVGSGKTVLKNRVMDNVNKSAGRLHLLWPKFADQERVQPGAIVGFILESFDQKVRRGLVASQRQLEQLLSHLHEQGKRVALGFDECHHLNDTTLLALKNFYELGTGGYDKYLGVVLFGQPRFKGRMQDYNFREIAERLEVVEMPKLGKQAWDYVAHRLKLAGGDAEKLFERAAITRLAEQSATPLGLGNLCNAALIKAHQQFGEHKVLASMIRAKADEPAVLGVRRAS
jgi:type II secretory pathway predicted ATPase ExeA